MIQGVARRQAIIQALTQATAPISATTLSKEFSVSRQVIVGDIAMLRASGTDISATPKGYVMGIPRAGITRKVACIHTQEDMERELTTIVQAGGEVIDVIVEHGVYGQLTGGLHIRTIQDVQDFIAKATAHGVRPLSDLTAGIHLHTIHCPDERRMEQVINALSSGSFLYNTHTLAL